uniref:Uncharacterized protein n=1 Tax=Arion vulgaris TaxID=1028688 RepID=A0A0B7BP73_9EUPU
MIGLYALFNDTTAKTCFNGLSFSTTKLLSGYAKIYSNMKCFKVTVHSLFI